MKKVVIFGGSGLIGTHLVKELKDSYDVVIVTRRPSILRDIYKDLTVARLRTRNIDKIISHFEGAFAVINLAGESVSGRWTESKMNTIRKSRADVDSIIVRALLATEKHPEMVIQGSAIGIYGFSRQDKDIDESSVKGKRGFLTRVAAMHEEIFGQIEKLTRVVYIRTGIVLDREKGALPKMSLPVKSFVGGKIGNGKQWVSWIHIKDEVRAIRFLMENERSIGTYNLTAPNPVANKVFIKTLAKIHKRPAFFGIPAFFVKLIFGRMADELLLHGLKVLPNKLLSEGFVFDYPELSNALRDIYKK